MASIRAVGLRALLVATQRARLRRLGQMRNRADRGQLLDHEPPPRRRLQSDLELTAAKPGKEPPHTRPVPRRDARPPDLARRCVQPLRRDLRAVLIEPHHDRPRSAVRASAHRHHTRCRSSVGIQRHTVWHGRYLLFEWSAARLQSARAFTYALRRGGPATFSRAASSLHRREYPDPAHAIFAK